jgi:uncharacterized OB-fold protein
MTSTASEVGRPSFEADEASAPFFEGAAAGVLRLKRCSACGRWLHPAAYFCSNCLSDQLAWAEASGRGVVHTFGIVHQLYHPGFAAEIPYNVAVVQLAEGPRLNTNIVGCPNDAIRVGMAVQVTFQQTSNGVSVPKFSPLSA